MFLLCAFCKRDTVPAKFNWTEFLHLFVSHNTLYLNPGKMPYLLISTEIRLETGPTIVGDADADPELMEYLGAKLLTFYGNTFPEYRTPDVPRVVLDKLALRGYRVVTMSGIGQTCIWTLYKPENDENTPNVKKGS
ncbi:GTP cyclohydrolase 1 feedback regulatory protein-like isoform X2 [Paramacrobiotus metropolitanus]|uniref:GTP cyclohydrolase 1 feedback regulatory protein-like isoform X2 n=1 Tax=Paramacrobiotus metropolitanus TaxID=2943436 RepID=UPI00244648FD|nr:GTP cyclohydrolase 1 feedback regulatory protein-like isoform X2 [Paramacrobiotus metropolitanus]